MLCWFVGGSVLLVYVVFRSPAIDYRTVALGSVLPVGEMALGGPRLLHTLLGAVLLLAVVMLATHGHRQLRRQLLGIPIGVFVHLVLDGVWARQSRFWWPFLGTSFGSGQVPELTRGGATVLLEVVGVGLLVVIWRLFGLGDREVRARFVHTGRLDRVPSR